MLHYGQTLIGSVFVYVQIVISRKEECGFTKSGMREQQSQYCREAVVDERDTFTYLSA